MAEMSKETASCEVCMVIFYYFWSLVLASMVPNKGWSCFDAGFPEARAYIRANTVHSYTYKSPMLYLAGLGQQGHLLYAIK